MLLSEAQVRWCVRHKHVILQVANVDRCQVRGSLTILLCIDRQNAVVLLVEHRVAALTVCFVLALVHIVDDQNVVANTESLCVKLLTANVTDADVDVLAIF